MKILGICGTHKKSPRFSSSYFLLEKALEAAKELGAETEALRLIDYNILRCNSCYSCMSGKPCPLNEKDDLPKILEKMREADAYIFSLPNYGFVAPSIVSDILRGGRLKGEEIEVEYYNYDQVARVKGKGLTGKVVGLIVVSAGIGSEFVLSQFLPAFIAMKQTVVASCGICLMEYDTMPLIRKQSWAKEIKDADFAIEMARAVGKRVVTGTSAFDIVLEKMPLKKEPEINVSNVCFYDIEDQKVSLTDYKGKILILVGGGEGATEESKRWGEVLTKEYGMCEDVMIVGIAIVGKLPPFVPKRLVKDRIKKASVVTPLIDWDGNSVKALHLDDTISPHVFLIDRQGFLRFRLVQNYSKEGLDKLKEQIEKWKQR